MKPRPPGRTPVEMTPGQLGIDTEEPWLPTQGCRCFPVDLRGCQHCRPCDTCVDCGRCAGLGCVCACEAGDIARSSRPPGPD